VAQIAHFGLGMRVVAAESRRGEDLERAEGQPIAELLDAWGIEEITSDVDRVLGEADVVSIHLPANEQTRQFVDARRLAALRPDALLVNTARGSVLDEAALYDALASGRLGGAGLDVFETEPYRPAAEGKDLRTLANVVLTPHIGSNTRQANRRMAESCLANVLHFFAGRHEQLTRVAEPPAA
jgi:lactate dehydrogenase-like 2-hydroxyacid dehydrogenase